ncbi:midasin-like [Papaver somniferum]|uniref:midasin-like n=1 Tax=Papaver somniferum TaxID=3469 RepID=UPI000E705BEE|nr:midasin-like [Papaver somniferum]
MSIDGSFSLESALRRFLYRCPKLTSHPGLQSLIQRGDRVSEKDVVSEIAELFIDPNYTIPVMGCFRPIALKVVAKAVELLRPFGPKLVRDSDSDVMMMDVEGVERVLSIEDYVRKGNGLELHELACLAFCRALDLAPFLLGTVLTYFKFAPPPFQRILTVDLGARLTEQDGTHLLDAIRASLRFLNVEPRIFSESWDWSSLLDLVQQSIIVESSNTNIVVDIRWCTAQILSIILKLNDRATEKFGLVAEDALGCLLRWEEFCRDVSLEKLGWFLLEPEEVCDIEGSNNFNLERCLQSFVHRALTKCSSSSGQVEASPRKNRRVVKSVDSHFHLTSTLRKSYEMVLLAVSRRWPILLYGPVSAGKTALINELAEQSGNQVLSIHMDEQMDGKTLIGSYICTEQPGEFRWQPGSLTQALLNGLWVVFEDFDKAPSDVQSVLLPLLEGASTFVTGRGEAISVAPSFRLFATISVSKDDISHSSGRISSGGLWRRVLIGPPNNKDLLDIVKKRYLQLDDTVAERIIETFKAVNVVASQQIGGFQSINRFSLRDLLKWCERITGLGFSFVGGISLTVHECKSIYQEAVDIFAASSAFCENRIAIKKEIAEIWGVSVAEAETLYPPNKIIIQDNRSELRVGRVILKLTQPVVRKLKPFVGLRTSLHVLEKIACSVKYNEPVLLVGETGTGKTTLVQSLAVRLGQPLTVLNLSQQSDVADLLGGLKPIDPQFICIPLYNEFIELFSKTTSLKVNKIFIDRLRSLRDAKNWRKLLQVIQSRLQKAPPVDCEDGSSGKRKKGLPDDVVQAWGSFLVKLDSARKQIDSSSGMAFSFVEGAFITALRKGHWILLDEINLAPPETLQRVLGVLEGESGSLCLAERGDIDYIERHSNFRIFACMNPATDAGKRDLPYMLRSRFSEYFVDEVLNDDDLTLFINQYLDESHKQLVSKIVSFYKSAKEKSVEMLQDGANQKPQFSLRSLYRALEFTREAGKKFGFLRALYDGFCMFFLTLLDGPSAELMKKMIVSCLLGNDTKLPDLPFRQYLASGSESAGPHSTFAENYVLTASVEEHLKNLARAVFIKKYPVLLQGPTSSGKTSLVHYLASITGHKFVRINNHEHTDLQEYLGSYVTDAHGKLVFQEGVLVQAVRNGSWIVLDELNLAPSDVLEALNRLLDDNRELFVPELQEAIRPHEDFMLFATQNPPTVYGGRKMLSRAFRNRFVEIHVDEIPDGELSEILHHRCKIPKSRADKMVEVMKELQLHRQNRKIFAGKHGFITPRDLFRWADRFRQSKSDSLEDLAKDGYLVLAERLRDESEKNIVLEVLQKQLRVKLDMDNLYGQEMAKESEHINSISWTQSMRRLYFLVKRCYEMREPVLLVGETGGGKTRVCQLLSEILKSKLHILNCHQHTETSDFLGGFYPLRDRSKLMNDFRKLVEQLMISNVILHFPGSVSLTCDIAEAPSTFDQLNLIISSYRKRQVSHPDVTEDDLLKFEQTIMGDMGLIDMHQKWQTIFSWQDGPLIEAMEGGHLFLIDEISLADDSVLERLNSVLEPERKLFLAEKGGPNLESRTADGNFFLLATMNPGGDYGKKELSPALRNRFTEIWVPSVSSPGELQLIAVQKLHDQAIFLKDPLVKFWGWFNQLQMGRSLTIRDLLSWVDFINVSEESLGPNYAFLHGAFLVLLDGLSLGTSMSMNNAAELREKALIFLVDSLKTLNRGDFPIPKLENFGWGEFGDTSDSIPSDSLQPDHSFGINSFYKSEGFQFLAPTTRRNASRVLRAMKLSKPVLLEGSPGVGKTSLIVALGKYLGHNVVRINLSEQTDMMDLLGSDFPNEDEGFAWSDGILLQALRNGDWVLLDELNLAPQSVLEGLNAVLDHRAEVFIPELGLTVKCPPSFRLFACQNPSSQGGGRKGLPKSFLNRFTKVYVDELVKEDYLHICKKLHPGIKESLLSNLIDFNKRVYEDTMLTHKYGQDGSPWEFNLRDVIRSCQIIENAPEKSKADCFLNAVYVQRMRTAADRREVIKLHEEVFEMKAFINPYPQVLVNPQNLIVGNSVFERNHFQPSAVTKDELHILPGIRSSLESALNFIQYQWLCILVGPSSSGKTALVRLLSQLTGNVLNELNLSSATDSSELLGCFEQYNAFRNFRSAIAQVEKYIDEYCSVSLDSTIEALISDRKRLVSRWSSFLLSLNFTPLSASVAAYSEYQKNDLCNSLGTLVQIIEELKLGMEKYQLSVSWSFMDLDISLKAILDLQENNKKHVFSAKFEWVTGLLIKAIECGEWVVLENANLCNPTVLDRINSLVEPSGTITVNECGLVDGKPVVLHPHSKFRLFLTVNPRYGEISRAMRNRGVEIFMMPPYWIYDGIKGYNLKENEMRDVQRFLVLSGIPISKFVDAMAEAHLFARDVGLTLGVQITLLELKRWVQLFRHLLMNGNRSLWSLHISWEHTYMSSLSESEGKDAVEHAKVSYLSPSKLSEVDAFLGRSLPGGWPTPFKLRDLASYSREVSTKQNCMYLEFLGAQCASYGQSKTLTSQAGASGDITKQNPSCVPLRMLQHVLFPIASDKLADRCEIGRYDAALANKMLFFAANWMVEQTSASDLSLYKFLLSWYDSQFKSHCSFFRSFLRILDKELSHPIWKCVLDCQRIKSSGKTNVIVQPLPLKLAGSLGSTEPNEGRLFKAIRSIRLLRISWLQWDAEDEYEFSEEEADFIHCLRVLEKEVLDNLIDSFHFDELSLLYTNLLEDHISFCHGITASRLECLVLSLRTIKKDVLKLQQIFPTKSVGTLLVKFRALVKASPWSVNFPKSMLWVHGGHPFLPSSAEIYSKVRQVLHLCEVIWPTKTKAWKPLISDDVYSTTVVSADKELRTLAMQGVCMSSYFTAKDDQDDAHIVKQLEEMHHMLNGRFEFEKRKMESALLPKAQTFTGNSVDCCVFCPELLCSEPFYNSWRETLPLCDATSYSLDRDLLQNLSRIILVDEEELYLALSDTSKHLQRALDYSLEFSSRCPTDFVPHKTILWTLDAWESVDLVKRKVATYILDMWFKWHSSLWTYCSEPVKNFSKDDICDVPFPYMLFLPAKIATLDQILQGAFTIKDYAVHCLKLRAGSRYLWQDYSSRTDVSEFLLSAAHSLFQQIIFAHKKSFDPEIFGNIESLFRSFQAGQVKEGDLQVLSELILKSGHSRLTSLVDKFIQPILMELYSQRSSHGFLLNLGRAWLHLGGLRFHLLLSSGDLDPAIKYSFKHSQLVEKISMLELEIKVRQECEHLAGSSSTRDDEQQSAVSLEALEDEVRCLKRKVVFREDPAEFTKLKSECADFLELVRSALLQKNLEEMDPQQMNNQACNWQETATSFINRLSDEYASYIDIIQPIQVAVFEMKLGLSLVVSSALQKSFLKKIEEDSIYQVLQTIQSFTQFPRDCAAISVPTAVNIADVDLASSYHGVSGNPSPMDVPLLKKLLGVVKKESLLQLPASLYHTLLARQAHDVINSMLIDTKCFEFLSYIFNQFSKLWLSMKDQTKERQEDEAHNYKFKTRQFKIEDILEVDVSSLRNSFTDETLSMEWQELLKEEESTEWALPKETENLEEEWNLIQDSVKKMVYVHNQFFGSSDLVERPGVVQISDAEKLSSFLDSYKLGMVMVKELKGILASSMDENLMPEHLLHLCLDSEAKFGCSQPTAYNFYKDSNAASMASMVEPLRNLQQRVLSLLNEWPDHPGLQKILDVTEMLLAIPLNTPLAKSLAALQFLLSNGQMLEENAPKFSLSIQLQPIRSVASSWQKMELDSWPALLDAVQEQYEMNSGKLWIPLYCVLHRVQTSDASVDSLSTIHSLEELIQTSSVGEFKMRLQLLLAFHGQIDCGIHLKLDPSPLLSENLKILYNVFGYYMQFLPLVNEHLETHRKNIVGQLKEHLKLCKWEHVSIETSKRIRLKTKRIIQKFNILLQQPVMVIINQEVTRKGITIPSMSGPNNSNTNSDTSVGMVVPVSMDMELFNFEKRLDEWGEEVRSAFKSLYPGKTLGFIVDREQAKNLWLSLENICETATACADLWKDETKNFGKRRALSDFLKLLENCGLSRRKSVLSEDAELNANQPNSWSLQPSYDVAHLLSNLASESNWETANKYYYKSLSMVQLVRQICLNFHKDFSLEQVGRSASFLDHLIMIQQEQRFVAYDFAERLKQLRKCTASLNDLHKDHHNVVSDEVSECSLALYQNATYKCMWQQKHLFDSLYTMSHESSLLLRKVEDSHLNGCSIVKVESHKILVVIERFMSGFKQSKESLDQYLLSGNRTVTTPESCDTPFIVSKQMEQLVLQNFKELNDVQKDIQVLKEQDGGRKSVTQTLLGRFEDVLNKGNLIMEEYHSCVDPENQLMCIDDGGSLEAITNLESAFAESVKRTLELINEAVQKLGSVSGSILSEDSPHGNITLWRVLFESSMVNLRLDLICEKLGETIKLGAELIDNAGEKKPSVCSQVQANLRQFHVLINLLLMFGDGILLEFLAMHQTVAEMTHMLANVFASLYSKGFGIPPGGEDESGYQSKETPGIGLGDGEGEKDVSAEITDEDQVRGTQNKDEGQDNSKDLQNNNDKGIEMQDDFKGDTCDVEPDSEEDDKEDDNDEEEEPDKSMGDIGDSGEVADETLGDIDDEGNQDNKQEKYETGSPVKDPDSSTRELRAKEDNAAADDTKNTNGEESDKQKNDGEDGNDDPEEGGDTEDPVVDKDDLYDESSGIDPTSEKENQEPEEDMNLDGPNVSDPVEPDGENDESGEDVSGEDGKGNPVDEEDVMEEETEEGSKKVETDDMDVDGSPENDVTAPSKPSVGQTMPDINKDHVPNNDSATRINGNAQALDSSNAAPEEQWANSSDMQNGLAPSRSMPSSNDAPQMEITVPDSTDDGKLTDDQPNPQSKTNEPDKSSAQRTNPNPYRSVADTMEDWKERVKVSVDSEEKDGKEGTDDKEAHNADEYGFVSEPERGTSEALGPATSDQMDKNIKGNEPEGGEVEDHTKENTSEKMEVEEQESQIQPVQNYSGSTPKQKIDERKEKPMLVSDVAEEVGSPKRDDGDRSNMPMDLVSINRSYNDDSLPQISNLRVDDDEDLGKAKALDDVSGDTRENASKLWREYELSTTRLSQELAEQLRLVMEPTVASKLQGDYKTGKRINMKKVIPYIASHYRKDKIWLRRTRPNKRDYQVIIAVDDSRSMAESNCGNAAIEALVTVCRAMSQLDVGQLAVASFGKMGNIKLLHDFDQPFTGESGIQMISNLTFKQENTFKDGPVVDLLKFLNNKLDAAVANSRLPSGQNSLQQLILIISDGRLSEQETLKRRVRDILNKKRMVAFLIIDSAEESIFDSTAASFDKEMNCTITKYLDLFPFPFYIVLENMAALPSTLADLIRQWFELMQNTRD